MNTYQLWSGDAPGALGSTDADIPTLSDYGAPSPKAQAACVICPGGGYGMLAPHEGKPVAEWLESKGVRSFVLKYRLGPRYHHPVMLHDAERGIRYVRAHATDLGVDIERVGVLGFSAGGHLASTVSTHNGPGSQDASDPIERQSSRPNWAVLIYPVVTMHDPYTHKGSRENLLGHHPDRRSVADLSNESAVSLDTPPSFIFHGADDEAVPIQNSLQYAKALADHHIPFELHVPQHGPHGFGLGEPGSPKDWTGLCARWLEERGL